MSKIKVTAVSYLNTKPFLYGIFKSPVAEMIDLQLDIPSVCAQRLLDGDADLGLVPVAVIPSLQSPHIVSDYCIGSTGAVGTVGLYADRPVEELEQVYLDHHSRTSVELVQILLRDYWKVSPDLLPATDGYIQRIKGRTGGLVIGDRTIGLDKKHPYVYDLGTTWQQLTGKPFVFAAWVSLHPLDPAFLNQLNLALQRGLQEIPQLIYLLPSPTPGFDLKEYYTRFISYELDESKKAGLRLFLHKLGYNMPESILKSLAVSEGF